MREDLATPSTPLDYAAPSVFFSRELCERNRITLRDAIACIALAVTAAVGLPFAGRKDVGLSFFLGVMSVAFLAAAAGLFRRWHAGVIESVRVTAHGIERNGREWSWSRIARVGAAGDANVARLYLKMNGRLARRRFVWQLSSDEYHTLRVELEHYFKTRNISVVVGRDIEIESTS